jgi:DNA polymerase bacteriophage-type
MTNRLYLDFESRSQCDIWSCGAWVYSQHPTTEVYLLAFAYSKGPIMPIKFFPWLDEPWSKDTWAKMQEIEARVKEGCEVHAHNAFFERSIWANIMTPKFFVDPIPLRQWRCTAAKMAAHALPRKLERAALALDLANKKDMVGEKFMKVVAKSTGPITPETHERVSQYCCQDVAVEREADERIPDLEPKEQRVWFLDQYINDTGVTIDREACEAAVICVKKETERLTAQLQLLTNGEVNAGTQTKAMQKYLESKGVVLPNMQKKTIKDAIAGADEATRKILLLRQQLSLTSNAKYTSFLDVCSSDGRVRDTLVYHGASTGRWAGKLVQLHNLVKPSEEGFDNQAPISILKEGGYEAMSLIYGDQLLNTLSSCIRGVLIPTPGYDMFITDFASIEARVVMWLADEKVGIKMFEDGDKDPSLPDIYVHQARTIYQNKSLVKKNKAERQVGKQTVLGGGFGMGPVKFYETCQKYSVYIGEPTKRIERQGEEYMVPPLAVSCIEGYRTMFSKVPRFWSDLEEGVKKAIWGHPNQVGKVVCYVEGEFLRIRLPSGRTLAYHRPRVDRDRITFMSEDEKTHRYIPQSTWGGTLVENVTQAVARDLMVESMFHFASTGFRILFTVHDELVLEAPVGTKTEEDVLKIVRTVPSWAQGCPMNAECEKAERYKK